MTVSPGMLASRSRTSSAMPSAKYSWSCCSLSRQRQHGDGLVGDDILSSCLRLFRCDVLGQPELVREEVGKADRRDGERNRHGARPPAEQRFARRGRRRQRGSDAGRSSADTGSALVIAHRLDKCRENLLDGTARGIQPWLALRKYSKSGGNGVVSMRIDRTGVSWSSLAQPLGARAKTQLRPLRARVSTSSRS